MKIIKTFSLLMLLTIFLSGCANKEHESLSIKIPNGNDYTVLYVQGVDKKGVSSESTSTYITDNKEIKGFI